MIVEHLSSVSPYLGQSAINTAIVLSMKGLGPLRPEREMTDKNVPPVMSASIVVTAEDVVMQETNLMGKLSGRFFNAREAQFEAAIRAKLIELGWTPPDWQPIATAPKDGTGYLARGHIPGEGLLMWMENAPQGHAGGHWRLQGKEWFGCRHNHNIVAQEWKPLGPGPEVGA